MENKNHKWTEKEVAKLRDLYWDSPKEILVKEFKRNWDSIKRKAYKLKIKRNSCFIKNKKTTLWSEKEVDFLIKNYKNSDKIFILNNLPGRTWSSIYNKAFKLEIEREKKHSNLSVLLEDNCIAFYWIGFLMADGHFSKQESIQVNLAKKDLNHLIKFSEYVEYKKKLKKPSISIMDKKVVVEIKEKFGIKNNKTYVPCKLDNIYGDLLFSLIIGFIDGDGSIVSSQGRTGIHIKCHKSWKDNLQLFSDFLCEQKKYNSSINRDGLARISITDIEILKKIKNKSINLGLPLLKRKWDKIDLKKLSKREKRQKMDLECERLFKAGYTPKEVIEKTGHSRSFVYCCKKRLML